jgi:hypothetical protein
VVSRARFGGSLALQLAQKKPAERSSAGFIDRTDRRGIAAYFGKRLIGAGQVLTAKTQRRKEGRGSVKALLIFLEYLLR